MNEAALTNWSTTAINLADHADNAIHTDEGAQAAGFEAALVAGTTVYAYLTHVPVSAWGLDWVGGGGGELALRRPVLDGDVVDCVVTDDESGGSSVTAEVGGDARSTLQLWQQTTDPGFRDGDPLPAIEVVIDDTLASYAARCGDDLALYADHRVVAPVTWVNIANAVFVDSLVTGPWVHVRSRIHHLGLAQVGTTIRAESVLIDRFDSRAGERALVEIHMYDGERLVAMIEHEAIVVLP